ncbi:exopolysaccharide production protein ExoZ [Pseudaminobacter salicylatoxidans]|uniref:Exopolysaccharide production protein ExoZ n=1 Tax=Pseudaminobacter salicylatoxidans TaxID=93369 RepID=A0A316C1F3_PSESE|nr:acyltransferase [Pseudaminobacter salicylatoxidans]PWJ82397.1 exopolysaccharide production protein ExoZ [Pseudaminobacter salicylatoxidans]
MNRLLGVQYLRAVAALGVVAFHAAERAGGHFVIGAAGVDIFFVVSGFIMWVIAEIRHPAPAAFLRDRVERIAPAYWIATGVMVAGGLAGLFPNMRLTAFHVFGSLAFLPHRSPSDGQIWPVLVQGWTLNYELFFYVLFAFVLTLAAGRRLLVLACLFAGLIAAGLLLQPQDAVLMTYTSPLLLEFLLGCCIGKLWLEGRIPTAMTGMALIVAAVVGFAFVGVTYSGFNTFILGPLAGALLIGVLALEKSGLMPRVASAGYLGDASYSIYLWHTMAISVVAKLGAVLSWPPSITFGMAVVCGTAVGLAAYELLEKPIAAFFKSRRHRRERRLAI